MVEYEERRQEILNIFRNKDYQRTIAELEKLKESYFAELPLWKKRNDLNLLMICYRHLIIAGEYSLEKIEKFKEYCNEYLEIANIAKEKGNLITWSDNILEDLFRYNVELLLKEISEAREKPISWMKSEFKRRLKELLKKFNSIFSTVFADELFYEQLLIKIYEERQNFSREGKDNYQNIRNTSWMSEVFLELTSGFEDYSQTRANVMNLIADLIYFFSDIQQERGVKEQESIKWLEKSLEEFPNNKFTVNRIKELKKFLTTTQQINKFRHDATSKISYLRSKLEVIIRKAEQDELLRDLLELYDQVEVIEGIFRLTKEERASFELVDIEVLLKEIALSFDELDECCLSFKGEREEVELDKSYFVVAVRNLIKNSLDAYRRNEIELGACPVKIIFDYNDWICVIEDWAGGIPEEFKENNRLFEPYISSKGTYQEVGLGLAQVKSAIELQEGRVNYESDEKGSRFIISLAKEE